jgi:hypothetical protein
MTRRRLVDHPGEHRCSQCWRWKDARLFVGVNGQTVRRCKSCRRKYANWSSKTFDEKLAAQRARPVTGTGYRVGFVLRSGNRKTGPIPVSMTDRASCPTTCGFRERGCYAEFHNLRAHWDDVGRKGMTWRAFCAEIAALPPGTLWRHNEAGDLPGRGDAVDSEALRALVRANFGRRGFTFTHKLAADRINPERARLFKWANANGFTVNLSADSGGGADELFERACGPVAVVLPHDAPDTGNRTPAGRRIVVCPAQTHAMTCADCQLCAQPQRRSIVGFRAHGQYRALVTELVKERRASP